MLDLSTITPEYVKELTEQAIKKGEEYISNNEILTAEALLKQAHKVSPDDFNVLRLLGQVFIKRSKPQEAVDCYKRSLEIDPDNFEALNNLALCYSTLGERDAAVERLDRAIEICPKEPSPRWNLAIVYKEMGDVEKACSVLEKAIEEIGDSAELYYHYGIALGEARQLEKASQAYAKAIQINENHAMAHWNRSLVNLALKNYNEGWKDYEWRWKAFEGFNKIKQRFKDKPEWQPKKGRGTVLVYNEQGIGDAIQFVRYLPMIKNLGYNVVLETLPSLKEIFLDFADEVIGIRQPVEYDYHVSVNTLPGLFDIVPFASTYIKPSGSIGEENFEKYKGLLKIGICWAGSPVHKQDKERSIPLKYFQDIHDLAKVKLFSLQKETGKRFQPGSGVVDLTEDCNNMSIVDMSDLLLDFNYTAAIIEQMDLIISADTAVAHLAGAMGKECWLLVPDQPDWRWSSDNEWYPSMRIFRRNGDWKPVFDRVVEGLKCKLKS